MMIKHRILWKIKEEFRSERKREICQRAKEQLEGLVGQIDGLIDLAVEVNPLPSSNADLMLDSTLRDEEALAAYQRNPLHNAVANQFVRPYVCERLCLDYVIEE